MMRALVLAAALGTAACYAEAEYPVGVTWTTGAPVYVESYPRVWYDGGWAYWSGDRWYWNRGGRWGTFYSEPPQLYRYRTYSAPPAFRTYRPPVYRSPPAYRPPVRRGPYRR